MQVKANVANLFEMTTQKRNHVGTVKICIPFPTADRVHTAKTLPFPLPKPQTPVAGLRAVGRRRHHNLDPCSGGLVVHKLPQRVERPIVRPSPLDFTTRLLVGTLSNSGQVFQGNKAAGGLCPSNNGLGDVMVHPSLKAPLPTRQPLQQLPASTPSAACALPGLALQSRSQAGGRGALRCAPTLFNCYPFQWSPSEVWAISVLPKSTPITLGVLCGFGASDSTPIWMKEVGTVLAFDQRGCFGMRTRQPAALVGANIQLKAFASLNGG